jgi:hypothetical protein
MTGTSWSSTTCNTYGFSEAADEAVIANGLATLANYQYALPPSCPLCSTHKLTQAGGTLLASVAAEALVVLLLHW